MKISPAALIIEQNNDYYDFSQIYTVCSAISDKITHK